MEFNLGGFTLGAGLVLLLRKKPEILSDLPSLMKDILGGLADVKGHPENRGEEPSGNNAKNERGEKCDECI